MRNMKRTTYKLRKMLEIVADKKGGEIGNKEAVPVEGAGKIM
ncbi:hypothetical protein [Paraflavitalea speifideaquila]|nr:hypothetical protein [Paraflavitalea speifideiaquila]